MKNSNVYSMLSIARKAGKVRSGEFSTEKSVKTGRSFLVVIAGDASDNTKKKFADMCSYYEVPCVQYGNKEDLGRCIGCQVRTSISVEDEGLAGSVRKAAQSEADLSRQCE